MQNMRKIELYGVTFKSWVVNLELKQTQLLHQLLS